MRCTRLALAAGLGLGCGPTTPPESPSAPRAAAPEREPPPTEPTSPATAPAAPEAGDPVDPPCEDPRDIASVSVAASFQSGGVGVWEKLEDQEAAARACFEREFPLAKRNPGRYMVAIDVANPDHAGAGFGFGGGHGAGGEAYVRGTYPGLERCLADAIEPQSAPPDVATVKIVVHILTRSEAVGVLGTRGGGSSGYGRSARLCPH
jgi:hypothetical protein